MLSSALHLAIAFAASQAIPSLASPVANPLWSKLLIAGLPSAFALILAWVVFRWNSQKDHERWVLDNKKAEWQEFMSLASEMERFLPSVGFGKETIDAVQGQELEQHLRSMTQASLRYVFVGLALRDKDIYGKLIELRKSKEEAIHEIGVYQIDPMTAHMQHRQTPFESAAKFHQKCASLWNEIHNLALDDLKLQKAQTLAGRVVRKIKVQWRKISKRG